MKWMNTLIFSKIILCLELFAQSVVLATEAVSNAQYKKFPPSGIMIGYTGQSLLVIIVAILLILLTVLVFRNVGRVIFATSWKIALSCVGFSMASVAFRSFSSGFIVSEQSAYYISSYNITSYFIVIGAAVWIPFGFCRSEEYLPDPPMDAERHQIRSTHGQQRMFTHRPHQDEDNNSILNNQGTREELPSYFEMMRPPSYKNMSLPAETHALNDMNDSSPSNESTHQSRPPSINDQRYTSVVVDEHRTMHTN
ncbi:uncharacterized protein EV154DRAFT_482573 [Mucor mucedo]|uniref:uncharacterized protein n=1 Tax=Mucor mucedo TaxID=29922 RepID=UPI00221E7808|nr:uncharacterized protein EV154DRAFT_482573 [Mucor mucedo]KAI7890005.1 hypothetical protein EV154DRAFT_482573 [Mucor mucedo]